MFIVNRYTQEVKEVENISTLNNVVFVFETQVAAEAFAEEQYNKRIDKYQKHIDRMKEKQKPKKSK